MLTIVFVNLKVRDREPSQTCVVCVSRAEIVDSDGNSLAAKAPYVCLHAGTIVEWGSLRYFEIQHSRITPTLLQGIVYDLRKTAAGPLLGSHIHRYAEVLCQSAVNPCRFLT